MLLKKVSISKIISYLHEIKHDLSVTPKSTNDKLYFVNKDQCKFMQESNHEKTSKGYEMILTKKKLMTID